MSGDDSPESPKVADTTVVASGIDEGVKFATLVDRHDRQVLAYCVRRATSLADAEDAAAEVFTIAWRSRNDAPDPGVALPWLFAIARRVLANQRRGNERRARLTLRVSALTEERLPSGEASGSAVAALERLGTDGQEILRLVAWEEMSHPEIAQVLGISTNAVAIRLHRARIRFERELRAGSDPDDLKEIAGRRTSTRLKGKMLGLLRREPTK